MTTRHIVTVASFPAYDVIKPHVCSLTNIPMFNAGDVVGVRAPRGYYKQYSFGSAVSYALKNGDDPIASYNREVERNNPTHWLNQCAVSLSSSKQEKKTIYEIDVYDVILFEGIVFRIDSAPNDNLKLVEISTKDAVISRRADALRAS